MELLEPGPDEALIKQAEALFRACGSQNYDGFEVWAAKRFVYRSSDLPGTDGKL